MKSVLFIHRSVGHNLIRDGLLYERFKREGTINFNDYDQNTDTFISFNGSRQKPGFIFPGNDTKPADLAVIFSQNVPPQYKAIQKTALTYDSIIIKSCYPNSNIKSDEELEAMKQNYQAITQFFAKQKDKKLIILTSPPLTPLMTSASHARRARILAAWLRNTTFARNISVFDFFDLLAAPENAKHPHTLKKEYRRWLPFDSHPNAKASQEIAPKFVSFLVSKII